MSTSRLRKDRPSDLVLTHLKEELQQHRLAPGSRLPSAVDLADTLGISQGTVKNVYRKLAQEGKVRMRTGDGSFWIGDDQPKQRTYRIGINTGQFEKRTGQSPTRWSHRIYGGLLHGKLTDSLSVQFFPCGMFRFTPEGELIDPPALLDSLDGVLLISLLRNPTDRILHHGRVIPCIAFNPYFEDASRNFVAPDYFSISCRLGRVWRKAGRRRILCLLSPAMEKSVSVRLRYGGLLCGVDPGSGEPIEVRSLCVAEGTEAHGYDAVATLLKDWRPDAIYAAGDLLAFGAIKALEEAGLSVPDEVSVVGGHGADFLKYPPRFLSCTEHGLEPLGEEMLRLLIARIDQGGTDVPAHIEPSRFLIGSTTTELENELLTAENPAGDRRADQARADMP